MKKLLLFFILLLVPFNIFAASIVADMDSKRIFFEDNIDDEKLIASTTKIMTAIIAIESNKLENTVLIGEEVLKMYGSNIYLELNESMLLLDLIYGLLLRSGNDAAISIAKYVGGKEEEFVKMMNDKAKSLKMNNTVFNNPHGLDEETQNYSTAYDLFLLYSYAYQNEVFKKIIGTKNYYTNSSLKSYEWNNRSKLLFLYDKTTGGKTGYTPLAGKIFVSSANNNDLNLCIVTFGETYAYGFHKSKYEEIFSKYKNHLILDKNNFKIEGVDNVYIKNSFSYPLTNLEYESISIKTDINKKDNIYGQIYVYQDDEILYKDNIYIKKSKSNLLKKIINFLKDKLAKSL